MEREVAREKGARRKKQKRREGLILVWGKPRETDTNY
jgi:hypothetical protein